MNGDMHQNTAHEGRSPALATAPWPARPLSGIGRDLAGGARLLGRTLITLPAGVLGACVAVNLLGLALPLAVLQVYDRIVPAQATETLALLTAGIALAVLFETALRIARGHVVAWGGMKRAWRANIEAAARVAEAPPQQVDAVPAARWIQRLGAVATVSEFHASAAPLVLIDLIFAALFLGLLALGDVWLAAVPIAVLMVFGTVAIRRGRELRAATAGHVQAEAKIQDFLIEVMSGIITVRTLGAEEPLLRRFERLSQEAAAHTFAVARLSDDARNLSATVTLLTHIATATLGAILAIKGEVSIGVVVCGTMLAGRAIDPLLRLAGAWNDIQAVLVAEETARPIAALTRHREEGGTLRRAHGPAALIFENVSFSYDTGAPAVLVGAHLSVLPGEIVAITGPDGIGKTTVARLAAGQSRPRDGQVLVGDARSATSASLGQAAVAIVDNGGAIVRGSVLDNLTLFHTVERLDPAIAAVRLLGLEEAINRLPLGYDTPLGGAASESLPAGFLQRIVIARAIASNPRLLILDEANNGFDYASEVALTHCLTALRGKITIMLITNRPSFAAIADRRFTIEAGAFRRIEHARSSGRAPAAKVGKTA